MNEVRPLKLSRAALAIGHFLLFAAFSAAAALPDNSAPVDFTATPKQWRIDLSWARQAGSFYEVERASDPNGPFVKLSDQIPIIPRYSDFIGGVDTTNYYRVRAFRTNQKDQVITYSDWSPIVSGTPAQLDPATLLDEIQEAGIRYFYDYAHPESGLAYERATEHQNCSTGATGMGMYNLVVGVERGVITRQQGLDRSLKILHFLVEKAERFHGAYSHFIDGQTGKAIPFSKYDDGADIVETAFLTQGVLLLREYFSAPDDLREIELRDLADRLWRGVEWDWFARDDGTNPVLMWHWSPKYQWKVNLPITGFNECQIVYLLAMASPTHPIAPKFYWHGWESTVGSTNRTEFGIPVEFGNAPTPLFFTHYSYLGIDPRQVSFRGRSYFEHFRDLCQVQVRYAESRRADFKGYGTLWGLTACDGPDGYTAFSPGALDNGTIAPTAMLSSMPYAPEECRAGLIELYEKHGHTLWGPFGFYDAFNFSRDWVERNYLGVDVGPIAPMIENYRTGLCWKTFMKAPEIAAVLKTAAQIADQDQSAHANRLVENGSPQKQSALILDQAL